MNEKQLKLTVPEEKPTFSTHAQPAEPHKSSTPLPIIIGGKKTGYILGDTYYTYREKKHFMIKYQGFGISTRVLDLLIKNCVKWVVIDYEGRKKYYTTVKEYCDSKKTYCMKYPGYDDWQQFVSKQELSEEK